MNSMDYLNKISSETKTKPTSSSLFSSKPLRIGLIAAAALAIFIIIFGLIKNNSTSENDLLETLNLRATNLTTSVDAYTKHVKSSNLRSAGSSLSSVLESITLNLTPELEAKGLKPEKPSSKILESETTLSNSLNYSLESGKLNGILDRTYAREFALQISLLLSLESELYSETSNENLKTFINTSYESLKTLYPNFDEFSETK